MSRLAWPIENAVFGKANVSSMRHVSGMVLIDGNATRVNTSQSGEVAKVSDVRSHASVSAGGEGFYKYPLLSVMIDCASPGN